ncbi:hypothetical protein [Xanthomonas sp. SS]|uniref:hypothetical protein n=1 Tax=Xanthomonas sp. SS TaxID=2724122 RepID=UPI001639AB68|nr:hypothetical protein [Xanthomonas sp. SS]
MSSRSEVYEAAGRALESSQLFEFELGTALLALDALESNGFIRQSSDAYSRLRTAVDGLTLGKSLKRIKGRLALDEDLESIFQEALDARNFLAHHLFKRNSLAILEPDGRMELVSEIAIVSSKVKSAYAAAQGIAHALATKAVQAANDARA